MGSLHSRWQHPLFYRFTAPLAARAAAYQQLAILLDAGFDLQHALGVLIARPEAGNERRVWQAIALAQRRGLGLSDAIRASRSRWPAFDLALLRAGERSGRLAACLTLLGRYHTNHTNLLRSVLAAATYPLVLLHALLLLGPLPALIRDGDLVAYLTQSLGTLAVIYALLAGLRCVLRQPQRAVWRASLEGILSGVPILGDALRTLALARLASALEALLSAGLGMDEAWSTAGAASGSPALAAATARFAPQLARGISATTLLRASDAFPQEFIYQYQAAEAAGRLDHSLRLLATRYEAAGFQSLRQFCRALPQLLLVVLAVLIGVQIMKAWQAQLPPIE